MAGDAEAKTTEAGPRAGISIARARFYAMMIGSILSVKTLRSSLNSVVPAMALDPSLDLNSSQQAAIMASFYPGYLLTQLPAGPIVQVIGGKSVMSLQLFGTAAIFLSAPLAMKRGGTALLAAALGLLGLLQGPMSPSLSQLNREWIPKGNAKERGIALRLQGLAHTSAPMLAALVTPFLARQGWRRVFYVLGGVVGTFAGLWQLLVSSKPKPQPALASKASKPDAAGATPLTSVKSTETETKKELDGPAVEYRILALPACVSLILWQISSNLLFMVLQQLGKRDQHRLSRATLLSLSANSLVTLAIVLTGPTFYTGSLGVTQERAGVLLALAQFTNIPAAFVSTLVEGKVLKLCGDNVLKMRRTMNLMASFMDALLALGYGASRNAAQATLFYAAIMLSSQCHMSGGWSLFYEIGGRDVATLSSVANTLANVTGLVVPYIGVTLLARFKSWMPLLLISASLKVGTGLLLSATMSDVDGREQLRRRAGKTKQA